MEIKSTAFANMQPIPTKFTCQGENSSPPLTITHVPDDAQSLALWVHDPDAPHGDFTHWILWNISPTTDFISAHQTPIGATEGISDFDTSGYGGPCPPSGTHRYMFELFALDSPLGLPSHSRIHDFLAALKPRIIAQTTLIGTVSSRQ